MAIHDKYFPGSTVSRYLSPNERSWDEAVYQSGKPVLDAELNLSQEVNREFRRLIQQRETPSGFLRGPIPLSDAYQFPAPGDPDFVADAFYMSKRTALVANIPLTIEYTNTTAQGRNVIQLDSAPVNGGAPPDVKRSDFVFLEVFRAQVSHSPHASGTITVLTFPTTGSITINGLALTPAGGARTPGANDYDNTLGSAAAIAAEIRDAINDPANGFAVAVSAQIDISVAAQVNIRATDAFAGAAGNAIGFIESTAGVEFTLNPLGGFLTGGVDTPNKPTQATIYRNGNVDAPAGVNLSDDIADPTIGTESTKRVQVQYRVRATGQAEAVNFKQENGFSNGNVLAQGTQATTVNQYRFVPADGVTVEAYIEVTGVGVIAPGDVITVDGVDLTAVNGVPVGPQFDVSSGVPATIVTSIVAAITGSVATANATSFGTYAQVVPATAGDNITLATTLTTATSVNTAVNSAVSYGDVDNGLFISGDGTQAASTDLGTVDGFVYAIPMCFVFRRNDASGTGGFDPVANTNGALSQGHAGFANTHGIGAIPAATSDRPDQNFHDAIVRGDLLDLRRHVSPGGVDLKAELESQMTALLDGNFRTWALDTQGVTELGGGSGDVSPVYLVCNEVGDQDTPRGETIGTWDHIRRRFADQSVVERRIFPVSATSTAAANPGLYAAPNLAGWQEAQVIHIDLDALDASGEGDWTPTGSPVTVTNQWPAGTKITDVLRVVHDDGNYAAAINQTVEIDLIQGVGTPHIEITLAPNNRQANGGVSGAGAYDLVPASPATGSPRRIFVELEITYPIGEGAAATPDETLTPAPAVTVYKGAALENDTSKRPTDWEDLIAPQFRSGYREFALEYVANEIGSGIGSTTPITESVVSRTLDELILPRRMYGTGATTVTVTEQGSGVPTNRPVDINATTWGSSERKVVLNGNLSAAQSLCTVEFFAQDPIPDFSSPGDRYQISVYFRSNAPQTVGVQAGFPASSPVPASLGLKPLVMSRDLWTGTTSSGSVDLAYPYSNPSDQIAVNADSTTGPTPDFPGEWALASLAKISVGDFDAETGLLNLHQMVAVDPNSDFTFTDRDWDTDFRGHYKVSDLTAYRPTAMSQPLSGVATHKVWFPFLAQASADNVFFRKGEVLLVVVSRYALLDGDNVVRFVDGGTDTCAAVYRTRGLLLLASEQ